MSHVISIQKQFLASLQLVLEAKLFSIILLNKAYFIETEAQYISSYIYVMLQNNRWCS